MGTSNWQNISYNIDLVKKLDPHSILDIGVGFGRWGVLFREFLEIWGDRNYSGKWNRIIDGVEIFPGYLKSYHEYFYDNIYKTDALEFLKNTQSKYDLINCGDVIEHFEKNNALKLISFALDKGKYVLINIPVGSNWEQSAINDNQYEIHRSVWEISDFTKYENHLITEFEDVELRKYCVVLLSRDRIDLKNTYGKYFTIKSILKNKLGLGAVVKLIEKRNDR
ncbi:MAG: class I SAM-dependent methyltransferase [Ignavibacteria bacterium]|nr:class I SAM-dependent methyltransferase [Ignavibacteria bacterium]